MLDATTIDRPNLDELSVEQLRDLAQQLAGEIQWRDAKIDKLTFELAQLKRVQFGVKSEQLNAQQRALFDEAVAADIAALEEQLEQLFTVERHIRGKWACGDCRTLVQAPPRWPPQTAPLMAGQTAPGRATGLSVFLSFS